MTQEERRHFLLQALLAESAAYANTVIPEDVNAQKQLLRGLMNLRAPLPCNDDFLRVQDEYLSCEIAAKGVTDAKTLIPVKDGLCLWQGDITTLKCDAIVNAVNSGMTGCYVPNHRCIDNCIHTFSGVQLRLACDRLMQAQGRPEATGQAKITPAFNLPCRFVLHTVGPIVNGPLTPAHCRQLSACYRACLTLAAQQGLESIAFCCISTGEFHFPHEKAAQIAVSTVQDFCQNPTSIQRVIFNVFKEIDRDCYQRLLCA